MVWFGNGLGDAAFNVYYWILNNNGKENKEGWNLRKVRMQIWCFSQESRQKVRNHSESQIRQSIQRKGKSRSSQQLSIKPKHQRLILVCLFRIASREWLLASGSASPQTGKLPVEHTNLPLPPLLPPRPTSTVCVDSGKLPPNEQPNEINRRCIRKSWRL